MLFKMYIFLGIHLHIYLFNYSCMYVFIDIDLYICHRQIHFHICAGVFSRRETSFTKGSIDRWLQNRIYSDSPPQYSVAMFCNCVRDKMWLVNHMFSCADIPGRAVRKANEKEFLDFPQIFCCEALIATIMATTARGQKGRTPKQRDRDGQSQKWRRIQQDQKPEGCGGVGLGTRGRFRVNVTIKIESSQKAKVYSKFWVLSIFACLLILVFIYIYIHIIPIYLHKPCFWFQLSQADGRNAGIDALRWLPLNPAVPQRLHDWEKQ